MAEMRPGGEPTFQLSPSEVEVLGEILSDWQDLCSSAIRDIPGAVDLVAKLEAWQAPACQEFSAARKVGDRQRDSR